MSILSKEQIKDAVQKANEDQRKSYKQGIRYAFAEEILKKFDKFWEEKGYPTHSEQRDFLSSALSEVEEATRKEIEGKVEKLIIFSFIRGTEKYYGLLRKIDIISLLREDSKL